MKTTIDIPDRVLKEALLHTGAKTKREAIVTAVEDFNRRRRTAALARHLGTCDNLMSPEELERLRASE
jgi:Arc/MetJ family transcription regulator